MLDSRESTISWMISLYVPRVRSLLHVREQPKASVTVATNALDNPLLMKMLTNYSAPNLPGVETEAIAVRDSCKILQCIRATSYSTTRDGIDLKV